MSAELDKRVDAARDKLINLAGQQIGMGNYKQIMREYQKLTLELINIMDVLNAQDDSISPALMDTLKVAVRDAQSAASAADDDDDAEAKKGDT